MKILFTFLKEKKGKGREGRGGETKRKEKGRGGEEENKSVLIIYDSGMFG